MAAKVIVQEFAGANGIMYYGNTLFYVNDWAADISMDTVDITNISIYTQIVPLPAQVDADGVPGNANLPFPENVPNPLKPYKHKVTDIPRKQSQYMAGRLNLDSGLRVATIECSGICGAWNVETQENVMPRIGNYCRIQLSNRIDAAVTVLNFPIVLIKNVSFDFTVKNYMRWTFTGISVGDFDIFPGDTD